MTDVERAERILAIFARAMARQNAGVLPLPLQPGDEERIQRIAAFLTNISQSEDNEARALSGRNNSMNVSSVSVRYIHQRLLRRALPIC